MENCRLIFPHCGKLFSTLWKTALAAVLLAALPTRAALPEPADLPFALPAADLRIQQTTTVYSPDQYTHIALLNRALAEYELNDLAATLARSHWQPQIADSTRDISALRNFQGLAPTTELQEPFTATIQLLQSGLRSWTLDPIQLLYTPGEPPSFCITFPLPSNAVPAQVGSFTADLPLPLSDAVFSQAAIQSETAQITRMEIWHSQTPPELFLSQTEPLLIAAGWTPPSPPTPPAVNPENQSARTQVLFMETILKNAFRVYHRGTSQLSILHTPGDTADPAAAPPHSYTFVHRTLLQWPAHPNDGTVLE